MKDKEAHAAAELYRAVEEFRRLDPKFSIQWVATFLYVAAHPGCRPCEIGDAIGLNSGTTAMVLDGLSDGLKHRPGVGLSLVERYADPGVGRSTRVRLTDKGRQFLLALSEPPSSRGERFAGGG